MIHKSEKFSLQRDDVAVLLPASSVYCMLTEGQERIPECGKMCVVVFAVEKPCMARIVSSGGGVHRRETSLPALRTHNPLEVMVY